MLVAEAVSMGPGPLSPGNRSVGTCREMIRARRRRILPLFYTPPGHCQPDVCSCSSDGLAVLIAAPFRSHHDDRVRRHDCPLCNAVVDDELYTIHYCVDRIRDDDDALLVTGCSTRDYQ